MSTDAKRSLRRGLATMIDFSQRQGATVTSVLYAMGLIAFQGLSFAQVPAPDLTVESYSLVTSEPVSPTQVDHTFKVSLTNRAPNMTRHGIRGTVSSRFDRTTVIDADVAIGEIKPSETVVSNDTFTIRQEPARLFDNNDLVWVATEAPTPNSPLEITIAISADSYAAGQQPQLTLMYKNVSTEALTYSEAQDIFGALVKRDGEPLVPIPKEATAYTPRIVAAAEELVTLAPGESRTVLLKEWAQSRSAIAPDSLLRLGDPHTGGLLIHDLRAPGHYELSLFYRYHGADRGRVNVYRGLVLSTAVSFSRQN